MDSGYLKIKKPVEDAGGDDSDSNSDEEEVKSAESSEYKLTKKRLRAGSTPAAAPPCCLVESCRETLVGCKRYYQRHRVCEVHAKAPVVLIEGLRKRFCQQCSRFHELSEFDQTKRSCRKRLAGHNERRRKSSLESRRNLKDFNICYKSL